MIVSSPYKAQITLVEDILRQRVSADHRRYITTMSTTASQGSEYGVGVGMMTRSFQSISKSSYGHTTSGTQFNVMLSRPSLFNILIVDKKLFELGTAGLIKDLRQVLKDRNIPIIEAGGSAIPVRTQPRKSALPRPPRSPPQTEAKVLKVDNDRGGHDVLLAHLDAVIDGTLACDVEAPANRWPEMVYDMATHALAAHSPDKMRF